MTLTSTVARVLRGAARRLDPPPPAPKAKPKPKQATKRAPAAKPKKPPTITPSTSQPGTRVVSDFFTAYPRFLETSKTSARDWRLNLRYEAIFAENRDIFAGARVLDIASHDGRWSLAALATGAASVVGVEGRPELVDNARESLALYGFGEDRFQFFAGDIIEAFDKREFEIDVALCLGFLYHTLNFKELLFGIQRTGARHVIIDTEAPNMLAKQANIYVRKDPVAREGNAIVDSHTVGEYAIVGRPNLAAMRRMMSAYGYRFVGVSDWAGLLRDNPEARRDVNDYVTGRRITVRFEKIDS